MCADTTQAASVESAADEQQAYASAEDRISKGLQNYQSTPPEYIQQAGKLGERFTVEFASPLPSLSNAFSKAYQVTDNSVSGSSSFALALDRQIPYRFGAIKKLSQFRPSGYMDLQAAGPVYDPQENTTRYCLIHSRPDGIPLSQFLEENPDQVNEKIILQQWMPALVETVLALHSRDIAHNRINPETIYIGSKITLGECISEPAGFSQDFHFEAPEKITSHPAGHGHGDLSADYYALGALLAYMLTKGKLFNHDTREIFTHTMLNDGAYTVLIGGREFSGYSEDFLRGTLNEKREDRWGSEQVRNWLKGKKFNLIRPTPPREAPRPFSFSGDDYFNRKSLAHGLFTHWASAQGVLRDSQLIRWLTLSALKGDLSRELERIIKATGGSNRRNAREDNELVAKTIIKLDPPGPIRMVETSASLDGLGTMLAFCVHENMTEAVEHIRAIIAEDLPNFWMKLQKNSVPDHFTGYLRNMEKLRHTADNTTLGFGSERLLYQMNNSLPCQSPLLKSMHVLTVKELLEALDYLAPSLHQKHSLVDRHIAAFLATRLDIVKPIYFTELESYRELYMHPKLVILKLIAHAHEKSNVKSLPGLTAWIAHMLPPMLDHLHSRSIRQKMEKKIIALGQTGFPMQLMNLMISRDIVLHDRQGFANAKAKYTYCRQKLEYLNNHTVRRKRAFQNGINFCRHLSYFVLLLTLALTLKEII